MMDDDQFWQWIDCHRGEDPIKLRLAASRWPYTWIHDAISQIDRQRRGLVKLPTLASNPRFLFPTDISVEQSTSEALARYHSTLIEPDSIVADFTAGLGVDAIFMAQRAKSVTAIDIDSLVIDALDYNARLLGLKNLHAICADCRNYLAETSGKFDTIFIDPARRADDGSRLYDLRQCHPDVVALLPALIKRCDRLIIKASPMLDIASSVALLPGVSRVIALGTSTECKELIFIVDKIAKEEEPMISAVTLSPNRVQQPIMINFTREEEANSQSTYAMPSIGDYLLTPYPATMKAAPFKLLSQRYGAKAISPNTHLYSIVPGDLSGETPFPGQRFRILDIFPYASSVIKRLYRKYPRALVSARNMGISADELRRKLKIAVGGETRVIGVTGYDNNRYLIIAEPA